MIKTSCYNFSFSGLKTHVTQLINKTEMSDLLISDIAYDFENAIIDVLITKTLRAAREHNIENIVIAGGVSANEKLRARCNTEKGEKKIFFPDMAYSTDNGAMIAYMGWLKLSKISTNNSLEINPNPSSRFV